MRPLLPPKLTTYLGPPAIGGLHRWPVWPGSACLREVLGQVAQMEAMAGDRQE